MQKKKLNFRALKLIKEMNIMIDDLVENNLYNPFVCNLLLSSI